MGKAYLVLANGTVFEGEAFGAQQDVTGELVFTTGMTGYMETLTDPSYYGQIVMQTFPLIGNYGVIPADAESPRIAACAYIVKNCCQAPSNFRSEGELDIFLRENGITGLCGIDTRALTKIVREQGVMNARIVREKPEDVDLAAVRAYAVRDAVAAVSVKEAVLHKGVNARLTVALLDYGAKANIIRELNARGCDVWAFPQDAAAADIAAVRPDGIMLSNGPGDPAEDADRIKRVQSVCELPVPIFGICLGHQLLALAHGFRTEKLKYGHRGANQPVRDTETGRVYISSQNHGYAVSADSINSAIAAEWFMNVNDNTCEGIRYKTRHVCSVQFHPEACGGPQDTAFLFDEFMKEMEVQKYAP